MVEAHGQRFFYHDMDMERRAFFHHSQLFVNGAEGSDGFGMGFRHHFFYARDHQIHGIAVLFRVAFGQFTVRLHNADDLDQFVFGPSRIPWTWVWLTTPT
jgi:hypothetical protein